MGKAGPKSKAPGGYGTINPKGYRRIWVTENGKRRMAMEHRVVWELHNGPIPEGMQIHHIDGDKLNNDISNLECVYPTEHKRIHSNAVEREDGWYKVCGRCRKEKHQSLYYFCKRGWIGAECKQCTIDRAVISKHKRKQMFSSNIKTNQSNDLSL